MSTRIFPSDILFFQRLLKSEGLYSGELDGIWGEITEAGATTFEQKSEALKMQIGSFDSRTEANIATLALRAQKLARHFMRRVLDNDINVRIISGTRTYEEQNILYRQGRYGNPGPVVTYARGGRSNHNFGIAWDIGIFTKTGGYLTDGPEYDLAAESGLSEEIEWGGHWQSFIDKPHYQVQLGRDLAELRARFERGEMFAESMIA